MEIMGNLYHEIAPKLSQISTRRPILVTKFEHKVLETQLMYQTKSLDEQNQNNRLWRHVSDYNVPKNPKNNIFGVKMLFLDTQLTSV